MGEESNRNSRVINKPYPEPELQSRVKERTPYLKRKQNLTTPRSMQKISWGCPTTPLDRNRSQMATRAGIPGSKWALAWPSSLRRVKPSTVRPLCRHTSPERKHGIPSKFKWNKTRGNIPIHGLDHATMKVRNPLPEIELVMYGKAINVRTEYYEGSGGSAPQVLKMSSLKEPEHGWELHILTCSLGRIIQPGCEACSPQALESLWLVTNPSIHKTLSTGALFRMALKSGH